MKTLDTLIKEFLSKITHGNPSIENFREYVYNYLTSVLDFNLKDHAAPSYRDHARIAVYKMIFDYDNKFAKYVYLGNYTKVQKQMMEAQYKKLTDFVTEKMKQNEKYHQSFKKKVESDLDFSKFYVGKNDKYITLQKSKGEKGVYNLDAYHYEATMNTDVYNQNVDEADKIYNYHVDLDMMRNKLDKTIREYINSYKHINIKCVFSGVFYMYGGKEDEQKDDNLNIMDDPDYIKRQFYFYSKSEIILNNTHIQHHIDSMFNEIIKKITNMNSNGSGWSYYFPQGFEIRINRYNPIQGSSYVELPPFWKNKQAMINIQNKDDKCFKYSVLASKLTIKSHPERVSHYANKDDVFDFTGIEYPTTIKNIEVFERNNNLTINVFKLKDNNEIKLIKKANNVCNNHINLALYKGHYLYVKNISALLCHLDKHKSSKKNYCNICLHRFKSKDKYKKHVENGCDLLTNNIVMPNITEKIEFKNHTNKFKQPFVVYADFESIITDKEHIPMSYGLYMKSINDEFTFKEPIIYSNKCPDLLMEKFFEDLFNIESHCMKLSQKYVKIEDMIITKEQLQQHYKAKICNICNKDIKDNEMKVKDHCHVTGLYRGAAHQSCNVNFNTKQMKINVYFHNLKNYDSHHIFNYINKYSRNRRITAIPSSKDKYFQFTIGRLVFRDSYLLLSESLDNLSNQLKRKPITTKYFTEYCRQNEIKMDVNLLLQKGVYPYEYMDSFDRLNENKLPSIESFFSKLSNKNITKKEYNSAVTLFESMKCKTIKDYHDIYLKLDVLLLADIIENYRELSIKQMNIDPSYYISTPSFAYDCMLKDTSVKCDPLHDKSMYDMLQRGSIGGICFVGKRKAIKHENNHLLYIDANALYASSAHNNYLPISNYKYCDEEFNKERILNINDDSNIGYIFDVDLHYPQHLHDHHASYPLAPEKINAQNSQFMNDLCNKYNIQQDNDLKIINSLNDKTNYVIHYRLLKLYLQLGLELVKVNKIIQFEQSPWLQSYVSKNNEHRKVAKQNNNTVLSNYYKLLNNSVYGRFNMNVLKQKNLEFVKAQTYDNRDKYRKILLKRFSNSRFVNFEPLTTQENDPFSMVVIEKKKSEYKLNQLYAVNKAILDNSKYIMYDFYYNVLKKKYPNVELCYTDTDSLLVEIPVSTDAFTSDLLEDSNFAGWFDFSNYPKQHALYNTNNENQFGKFKDEMGGRTIEQFIGLRPKLYNIICKDSGYSKIKAKSVKNSAKNDITKDDFERCLTPSNESDAKQTIKYTTINCDNHLLNTKENIIRALSSYDNKRYYIDNTTSLPFGHYKIVNN